MDCKEAEDMSIIGGIEKRMAMGALDDSWYQPGGSFYGGMGPMTKSGSAVSEFNAMQLAVVWCCIKILSEDIASLPLHLYRRRKGGGKDRAWADDRYFLLHDHPNSEMTAMSFREAYASHLLSWGNGYAEIERTRGLIKKPIAIWPITPNRVTVKRNDKKKIVYDVNMCNSVLQDVTLQKSSILHTPGLSFNGLVGYSPIAAARQSIGLGMSLEEFGSLYFGQGTHPGVIISHPGTLSTQSKANLASSLAEEHSGLGKTHRLMLLDEGMKMEKIGIPNDEAQFLESRKFQNVDIGTRIFRLHPHMYGEFDKAVGFNSAEQFAIDYATKTLRSWLVRLEQSYNMALLDPSEYGVYFWEHNMEGLLRGDAKSRSESLQIQRRNGVLDANEWRELENMNPEDGDQGNKFIVESNMVDLNDLGKVPPTPTVSAKEPATP